MRRYVRTLIALLLIVVPNFASLAIAEAAELTLQLVASRINTLRASGAENTDETLKTYETTRSWLNQAASQNRDAVNYLAALESAPRREAEILARLDALGSPEQSTGDFEGLSREALEAQLTLTRTDLQNAISSLTSIEQRLAARESNANFIRTRLGEIAQRHREIDTLELAIDPDASPSIAEALLWLTVAERIALDAERRAQEARLSSQPARYRILQAESAELKRLIEMLTAQTHMVESMARSKILYVPEPEELGIGSDHPLYGIVSLLLSDNTQLRERRIEVEVRIDATTAGQEVVDRATRALGERFANARRVVEFASDSDLLGKVLLAYWQEIERFRLPEPTERLQEQVGNTVISRINHEQAAAEYIDTSAYVAELITAEGLKPDKIPVSTTKTLIELARAKRELLRRIIAIESDYIHALSELDAGHTRLTKITDEYEAYLGALILWIPSRQLLWKSKLGDIPVEFDRLLSALGEIRFTVQAPFVFWFLIAIILTSTLSRAREAQHALYTRIIRARDDSVLFTLAALVLTGLRAAPTPLFLFAIGKLFSQNPSAAAAALITVLNGLILVLFALSLIRILCEELGVARTHFGWHQKTCDRLFDETSWLIRWWLPVATLAGFLFIMNDKTILLGRISLLLSIFLLVSKLVSLIRWDMWISGRQCLSTSQNMLRLALIAILIAVVAGVIWGLRYSVSIFTSRLLATFLIGVALLILHNLLLRGLRVARRRLHLAERLAAQTKHQKDEISTVAEDQADLIDISAEATRLLNASTLTAVVVALLYIWAPLLPVFDASSRVTLWTSTAVIEDELVTTRITLETLMVVIFLVSVTFYAVQKLPALAELILRARTSMTPGARYTTSTLLSYVIVGVGIVAALSALGLRWSQLQWLIAAMGVGIGFGLQEIIANFISGIIILFERPIRVGDVITVGDKDGTVTKIRIRATTIVDFDGKELLVPNKEFITGRLLNWTLSDPNIRLFVPVGIAYGSDVERALKILREIADDNPIILDEPEPSIIFSNFGDHALELVARFYIGSIDDWWPIITEVRREIYKRFAEADITIAFPQRDVHLNSAKPIRIAIDPPAEK